MSFAGTKEVEPKAWTEAKRYRFQMQNQGNHSDQSQQEQTARWTNHNSLQLHVTRSKREENDMYMVRLVLVLLLIGWKTGASLLSQSQREAIAIT